MPEPDFEPCRPGCWICKPGSVLTAPAARIRPTGEPYPIGPSVDPYRARIPVESVMFAPIRSTKPPAALVTTPLEVKP